MAKPQRPGRGRRLFCLPRDYTVVDVETTGLSTESCSLIEVAALRVRGGEDAASFSTLVRPPLRQARKNGEWTWAYVDDFIQGLTGITDGMLEDAPPPEEALPMARAFFGEDILLGHNVGFDAAFLYDSFQKHLGLPLENDTLDHLAIARKVLPGLAHHRLGDVAAALSVPYVGAHRALADCRVTYQCYEKLRAMALSQGTEEDFARSFQKRKPPVFPGVPGHPFYKKRVALTGALNTPQNREAVLRAGGTLVKQVGPRTDFVALPAPGDIPIPGREGGPAILPQGAFYRLLGPLP